MMTIKKLKKIFIKVYLKYNLVKISRVHQVMNQKKILYKK